MGLTLEYWKARFREARKVRPDPWLAHLLPRLELPAGSEVLELGCGAGDDARYLSERGFRVLATDFSEEALRLARARVPTATFELLDVREPFPFAANRFAAILASLSLHYFSWAQTVSVTREVRRCLAPGGVLIARLNSVRDTYHRELGEQLAPHYYLVNGLPRRFFDEESVRTLFKDWDLCQLGERVTYRYGREKTLWEVLVRKPL